MNEISMNQLLVQMREMTARAQGLQDFTPRGKSVDFSSLLQTSIDKVNDIQQHASNLAARVDASDKNADLGDVMVSLQKANVTFQAMTEVRNRLVAAYQDIMNMQI